MTVYDIKNLDKPPVVINVAKMADLPESKAVKRAVQAEYNATGDEVWYLDLGGQDRAVRDRGDGRQDA